MRRIISVLALVALATGPAVSTAQVRTIDPNQAIANDQTTARTAAKAQAQTQAQQAAPRYQDQAATAEAARTAEQDASPAAQQGAPIATDYGVKYPRAQEQTRDAALDSNTYQHDDVLSAAEGVFGKGAAGLAGLIEKILRNQGRPNAYVAGSEASGAFALGLRYGKGVLSHKVEGTQPIYWTGPSLGFDVGGDAAKVFILVYNLYDTEDLYRRFPGGEGRLYLVGGFSATYLRRGRIVLIPIRLGVGWRAGVNLGYAKFSHKNKWFPL